MEFPKLRQTFRLKNLELRNRIFMAPMLSRLCYPRGVVSPKLIDYYVERAKGGVGLIIVEYCYIDEKESKANLGQLGAYDDQLLPGLGDLAEAIQEWGAKAVLQICHAGRCTSKKTIGRQPIAPSAMSGTTGEMAREMTLEEIEETIESFAEAARRAKSAGFDGVELHGAHGYLLAQFLSPYTNRRADAFGRDRGLFALKTLERVRSKVGSEYLVGYRISAQEFLPGGLTPAQSQAFAQQLAEAGIDYLHVSAAIMEEGFRFVMPMYIPQGSLLHLAEGIKKVVKIPVIAVGAVHDPTLAEEALEKGQADLIAMGRALIADPALPEKIQSGRVEEIRTCLRCNEGCVNGVSWGRSQRCAVNAEVGREREMRIHPVSVAKHVCVIGGGPAGMEAARVLALRKHRVTLIEREKELGGLGRYASVPEFKGELRSFLAYLRKQMDQLPIEIIRERRASVDLIKELRPDAVVLATGSTMNRPNVPGISQPFVATALDLLSGKFLPGEKVFVAGGAAMGCEVAVYLAAQKKKVVLGEMLEDLAPDLEPRSRTVLLQMLKESGVEIYPGWKLEKIEGGRVFLANREWETREITVDSVVLAMGLTANRELLQPLRENFGEVYPVGDCLSPRKIYQAIHEAAFVGRTI